MATVVGRAAYVHSYRRGRGALEQRFQFGGDHATADAIADVLLTAPLIGEDSVFGRRPGTEGSRSDRSRSLRGFSPAPGFRFDVDLTQRDGRFVVRFSQPDRNVPYLQGELLWIIADQAEGAVLDEQINTERALQAVSEPLGGPRRSLRRWLFFLIGHKQVMVGATRNIAALLDHRGV
ncbi:MAG: hypothetical protein OEM22_03015 [Acidimicrobiia bacterium]|nr:hypothetical protein [Acidimicrobiia bacterium]